MFVSIGNNTVRKALGALLSILWELKYIPGADPDAAWDFKLQHEFKEQFRTKLLKRKHLSWRWLQPEKWAV